jgi:hypothetical protein
VMTGTITLRGETATTELFGFGGVDFLEAD